MKTLEQYERTQMIKNKIIHKILAWQANTKHIWKLVVVTSALHKRVSLKAYQQAL